MRRFFQFSLHWNKMFYIAPFLAIILSGAALVLAQLNDPAVPGINVSDYRATMIRMLGEVVADTRYSGGDAQVFRSVEDSGDPLYIAPLIDLAYFARDPAMEVSQPLYDALETLSSQSFGGRWPDYFEWASENDITLPPHYAEFKGLLLASLIDPEFARFFPPGTGDTAQINLLEAVWGGVLVDGIPSLVNAPQVTPDEATAQGAALTQFCRDDDCAYPAPDEYVFGVSLNGDNRAYPLRILNWHEMFNDVLGYAPLYAEPDGDVLCNFRAPVDFAAVGRWNDSFVQVVGGSAGCVSEGSWLSVAALEWNGGAWDDVSASLPNLADDEAVLNVGEGQIGRVSGMPVMLAYCTLCGSGILYDVTMPDLILNGESIGRTVLQFGSTGLLMRSNKLMYDRNTDTVWNAMTGEPAFGPLAGSDIQLSILPIVVSDWASWLEEHPDTSVLSLDTGYGRDYSNGGAYGDYFNNPDFVMFPVWQQDNSQQQNKEVVFTLLLDDTPKAYPIDTLIAEGVSNDTLAQTNVVLITQESAQRDFLEPGGAAVRAYLRGEHTFSAVDDAGVIVDENGGEWTVSEDALVGPNDESLERIGGHLAFWFGWYAFYPDTLVYEG